MQTEGQETAVTSELRPKIRRPNARPEYFVVTPAFNEADNLSLTIESMCRQEHPPRAWVLVDDNSSDGTWDLITEAARRTDWIHALRHEGKADSEKDGLLAATEAAAFLEGLKYAVDRLGEPEFVVKLDADLEFQPTYFTSLFEQFANNPSLGIAGGTVYEHKNGRLVKEQVSRDHVRGATKVYRWNCYRAIGGVRPVFGWDAVDELLAWQRGWEARSFNPPSLIHLRRTASRNGRFRGWMRNGRMVYFVGFSPFRTLCRAIYRATVRLDPVHAGGLLLGYTLQWIARRPQIEDPDILAAVKKYQWRNRLRRPRIGAPGLSTLPDSQPPKNQNG